MRVENWVAVGVTVTVEVSDEVRLKVERSNESGGLRSVITARARKRLTLDSSHG